MDVMSKHILIAEDEFIIASLYQEFLKDYGYSSTICEDGRAALEMFKNSPMQFDLLITDQNMPHMTGTELSDALLKISPELPIILLTGFDDEQTIIEMERIGIQHYLNKPVNLGTLRETIDSCLTEVSS